MKNGHLFLKRTKRMNFFFEKEQGECEDQENMRVESSLPANSK
jgi:hypothetical protein